MVSLRNLFKCSFQCLAGMDLEGCTLYTAICCGLYAADPQEHPNHLAGDPSNYCRGDPRACRAACTNLERYHIHRKQLLVAERNLSISRGRKCVAIFRNARQL